MQGLRTDRNNPRFDGFDYERVGTDDHLYDCLDAAENHQILRKDYISTIMRDLRGQRFGNHHLYDNH